VPEEFLDDEQREHAEGCGPHVMALELVERPMHTDVRLELLVRAKSRIRCSCIRYAPPALREHMIDRVDTLIRELDIPV
jgi:predicted transposase YdaD